ncbi:hypothetical protein GCM10023116_13550 [Kistimonas scapharcae]|uniref:VanZ-like domain-containing protein n=1 Tax=Kistimonas scapharcae TaxID=1036133 RepID=A0ABP8UZW6_9GAMM
MSDQRPGGQLLMVGKRVVVARCLLLVALAVIGWIATFSPWQPFAGVSDKLRHVAAFLLLTALVWQSFPAWSATRRITVMVLLALGVELVQTLTPTREFHLDDLAASVAGTLLFEFARAGRAVIRSGGARQS